MRFLVVPLTVALAACSPTLDEPLAKAVADPSRLALALGSENERMCLEDGTRMRGQQLQEWYGIQGSQYSPSLTATMAAQLQYIKDGDDFVYADKVRAYRVEYKQLKSNFFGQGLGRERELACYTTVEGGKPRVLLALTYDDEGRVRQSDFQSAVFEVCAKIGGYSVTRARLLGCDNKI